MAESTGKKAEVLQSALDEINRDEQEKLDVIKQQLKDADVENLFGTKKEIKALPDTIDIDGGEKILYAANAFIETNSVLVVCTNKRVIFLDHGLIYGSKSTDIPLDMINSVSYSKGLMLGSIAVTNGVITTQIENMQSYSAKKMAETIKQAAADFKQTSAQSSPGSNLSELRELKKLLDDGIITEEEFAAKKKQILGI
ncbi:PH domain-containing protein [Limosilactobacillus sp. pH52_RY]|nr:PH domain-containing protein [Limosilactobacillus balticus]